MNDNEQKQPTVFVDTTRRTPRTVTVTGKQLLIAAVALVVVELLVWKAIQLNSLKKERRERELALKTQYKALYTGQSSDFLRRLAKPCLWALRTEPLQGNNGRVNVYNNDTVKEKNVQSVMVTDAKGIITSGTGKKYEGRNFLSLRSGYNLNADSTVVNPANDSLLILASPIMSFNSRLGTLIVNCTTKTRTFSGKQGRLIDHLSNNIS